jgi:hypothetical protein
MEAAQRVVGGDAGRVGPQRRVGHVRGQQRVGEALGVLEAQLAGLLGALDATGGQSVAPERDRRVRRDAPLDPVDRARAATPARDARELEEREMLPGAPASSP